MEKLRNQLKDVQCLIDKDPHDGVLRDTEVKLIKEYMTTVEDEQKLLFQKSKINWLSLGDRNNVFFS